MPIYGKNHGKKAPSLQRLDRTKIARVPGIRALQWHKNIETESIRTERAIIGRHGWGSESTKLRAVNKNLGFSVTRDIRKRIRAVRPRPAVVLEWGCGKGTTAEEIAKKFGQRVRVYGFSDTAYKEWGNSQNVKYIHGIAQDLPRYVKNGSVDLIYSSIGLLHLPPKAFQSNLAQLLSKLAAGGKIVTDIGNLKYYADPIQKTIGVACEGTGMKFKVKIKPSKKGRGEFGGTLIIEREK
ncbi:MAG: class I SAM-dependent methyltransferase [Candidatus Diapherotrites archaeon]